jgi:Zn-finger nucleic acid-binding protein
MNEEKDRYGDFISLLERAREDVYFAQKDRELLDKQKHGLKEAHQDPSEHHTGSCPECGIVLHKSILMDVAVSRCSACGGTWVARIELQRLMNLKKIESTAYSGAKRSLRYLWPDERRQS